MIKKKVLHFVRKSGQLEASFIYNQIAHHIDFEPLIVFRKNSIQGSKNTNNNFRWGKLKYLDLSQDETFLEKLKFTFLKILSKRQVRLIEDFIKIHQIDICHFHYGTDCGSFYPLQRKLKKPSIVSFYGYDAFSFPGRFLGIGKKYLNTRVLTKVDHVLAMSPEMEKDLIQLGCSKEKLIVHYHGVPSQVFKDVKRSEDQESNTFRLLNISYFDPVKGHIFIFKAIKKLIAKGVRNIHLRIAGYGYYEAVLFKYIRQNKLNEYVSFIGKLNYGSNEMISELENADAFIHPSVVTKNDKEGIPGAVVEAMFSGLPVISTYHGGIPHIIENDKTGLLVEEWQVDQLSNAIEKLATNRIHRKRIGRAGQEFAMKNLDLQKKETDLEKLYLKVIVNKRSTQTN